MTNPAILSVLWDLASVIALVSFVGWLMHMVASRPRRPAVTHPVLRTHPAYRVVPARPFDQDRNQTNQGETL